ncbi:PTS sugar transporter subunit IIB [Enterococcus faecalis ATCC 29212]
MPNILLTRIDNRLIHGQVATQWNGSLGANLILVANDAISEDTMRQQLLNMAALQKYKPVFFPLRKRLRSFIKPQKDKRFFC